MSSKFLQLLLILFSISTTINIALSTDLEAVVDQYKQTDITVYSVVQVPPTFPGSNDAMFRFIQSASQYPVNLKKGSLIQLKLLIEKDGSISSIQVNYSSVTDELTQEAVRIAKMMPKWIPGSQDGRLLRVYALMPIRFVSAEKL